MAIYAPTQDDIEAAEAVLDSDLAKDGQYRGRGGRGEVQGLRMEFLSNGDAVDGGQSLTSWESTPVAFVAMPGVAESYGYVEDPEDGDLIRVGAGPWHRVRAFSPEGALWRLELEEAD